MIKNILVTVPNLSLPGGVSAFWNALLPEFEKMDDVHFRPLEIGGHGRNVFGPLIDIWKLRKLTKLTTDLIILNPSLGRRSFFRDAFLAKYLVYKNIPFVVIFHGWNLQFEKEIDKKFISFFQSTFGKAKKIFVLSNDFKDKLLSWGYQGEVVVTTTTVDAKLFDGSGNTKNRKNENTEPQILFLSRLIKDKGIYETISAFNNLINDKIVAKLIIAGSGEELENIVSLVGDNEHILMAGHVEGQDKIDLYKNCTFYCLPSYSEGLPISVLEAMSFGKPVITTPVGGLKNFFQDGVMGFFVQPKKSSELEVIFRTLLHDEELRNTIGNFNYNYAHQHIMSDKVAQKMLLEIMPYF